jgi:hypothetical protein
MKQINLSTEIATPQLQAMFDTVGAGALLAGTVYSPLMQLVIAPAQQGEDALVLWELAQKLYANRDGFVDLSPIEIDVLKQKCQLISFPWLRARVLEILG